MILEILQKIAHLLPEVKKPESPPALKERFIWTGIALILFFVMYNTMIFGVSEIGAFNFLNMITAARQGTLLTTGIGPIVLASIFLQLFVGAKILNIDMKNPNDKKKFHEAQKVLAIIIALAEATIFVTSGYVGVSKSLGMVLPILAVIQIALGSVILLYMDEIITKYGIGSGISLFIAAGVSFAVIGGLIDLVLFDSQGVVAQLTEGGAEGIPNAILALLPFIFTIIVFAACVFAESTKVEVPIAHEHIRGMVPKIPLNFFYVSNIPVIFASALLVNVRYLATFVGNMHFAIAGIDIPRYIAEVFYLISPSWGNTSYNFTLLTSGATPILGLPEWIHAIVYIVFLGILSILFGIFWAETSNMDSKSIAGQLDSSGMQVPGYRRDPRMLEKVLEKYIFPLTVVGSFSVGILAGIADLTGALGTGTGILLTVGILHKLYQQLKQMKAFELYPSLGGML